jgi:hypothetical protein
MRTQWSIKIMAEYSNFCIWIKWNWSDCYDSIIDIQKFTNDDLLISKILKYSKRYRSILNDLTPQDSWFWSFNELIEFEKMWYEIRKYINLVFWTTYQTIIYYSELKNKIYNTIEEYNTDLIYINKSFLNWEKISWTVRGFEFFPDEEKQ